MAVRLITVEYLRGRVWLPAGSCVCVSVYYVRVSANCHRYGKQYGRQTVSSKTSNTRFSLKPFSPSSDQRVLLLAARRYAARHKIFTE